MSSRSGSADVLETLGIPLAPDPQQALAFLQACGFAFLFAPFFHPKGDKIIFASNINSETGRNFDIYTINLDGTGLEQITFNETFDGFPIFSRDGKKLIFCSNRFNKKEGDTNVFTADWID